MTEAQVLQQQEGLYSWGFFQYDPEKKLIIRDEGTVQILLTGNEAVILESLLKAPKQRVPYADIYSLLKPRPANTPIESYNLALDLTPLRLKIGDVNYGKDVRERTYGMWRYINQWKDKQDGDMQQQSGLSGLVLQHRTVDDIKALLKAYHPHPYWNDTIYVEY